MVMSPSDPQEQARWERGAAWRAKAEDVLASVTSQPERRPGHKPAWDEFLVLGTFQVREAARCTASLAAAEEEYVERTMFARRRVGLAIVDAIRQDDAEDPVSAYDAVKGDLDTSGKLTRWVAAQGEGGDSALAAAGIAYAAGLINWLHPTPLANTRAAPFIGWEMKSRIIKLTAQSDALSGRRSPAMTRLLVVVSGEGDAERVELELGHAALTWTLMTGAVPAWITWLHLPSGRSDRVVVTDEVLEGALSRAATALHGLAAARYGPPTEETPGGWCRRCKRLDQCPTGPAWLDAQPVRIGGLTPAGLS